MADELEPVSAGQEPDEDGFWQNLEARQQRQLKILAYLVGISILVLLFIIQNNDRVELSFIVFSFKTSLIWLIVMTYTAGALSGHLVTRLLRRRFFGSNAGRSDRR
jgi:uncharacterized integral membrane protein